MRSAISFTVQVQPASFSFHIIFILGKQSVFSVSVSMGTGVSYVKFCGYARIMDFFSDSWYLWGWESELWFVNFVKYLTRRPKDDRTILQQQLQPSLSFWLEYRLKFHFGLNILNCYSEYYLMPFQISFHWPHQTFLFPPHWFFINFLFHEAFDQENLMICWFKQFDRFMQFCLKPFRTNLVPQTVFDDSDNMQIIKKSNNFIIHCARVAEDQV